MKKLTVISCWVRYFTAKKQNGYFQRKGRYCNDIIVGSIRWKTTVFRLFTWFVISMPGIQLITSARDSGKSVRKGRGLESHFPNRYALWTWIAEETELGYLVMVPFSGFRCNWPVSYTARQSAVYLVRYVHRRNDHCSTLHRMPSWRGRSAQVSALHTGL